MAICKWCGEENADGVNVCSFCGQDMSIFEDSGMLKNVDAVSGNAGEASRSRIPVAPTGTNMNSGSFSTGAVRTAAARGQQNQQSQKKSEFVTRNQLKQVAYRLDSKSKSLSVLTIIVAVISIIGLVLSGLSFVRSGSNNDHSEADSTLAQLQSKVSTLELELQTVNAKLAELQTETASRNDSSTTIVNPDSTTDSDQNSGKVNVTTTEPDTEPDEPSEPAAPTTSDTTNDSAPTESDTEIEYAFEGVDGDGTSVYATVAQSFEGTTTYQWQKKANSSTADNWSDVNTSAAKTDTLKISIDDYLRNNSYRCRVTNVDSKGVTTVYYTEVVDYTDYQIWSLIG